VECSRFHDQCQAWLDARRADCLPGPLAAHAAVCPSCERFFEVMNRLDGALRAHQQILPDESLLGKLAGIPLRELRGRLSIRRALSKGIAITVPAAALLLLGTLLLPSGALPWVRLAVLTTGLAYLLGSLLEPSRIGVTAE
jgi:hypothetical protein